ncbi:hypothetical protein [Herbaspirillum seropedicae]|uniref:hypothetical protein n=1 Tax=Herbaspirillum seropedicae TaxID=964 RepID=UPI003D95708E
MAAHNSEYPWLSYHGNYRFFEERMMEHSQVTQLDRLGTGHYRLVRSSGQELVVFICECYSFGASECDEVIENIGPIDAVVINSSWCGYALDFKLDRMKNEVGIFTIGEFMAALNMPKFWLYLSPQQKKDLERRK